MIRTVLVAITATLVSVATGISVPASSAAPPVSAVALEDGPDDVWIGTIDTENPTETSFPAADVLRARITHGPNAVRIRMRFGDLQRLDWQDFSFAITTARNDYKGGVVSKPGHRGGKQSFLARDGGGRCRRMTHAIDYDANVVYMRVPRSCLGHPRWVKVALWNRYIAGPGPTDSYLDNPLNHQNFPQRETRRLYRSAQ